jgi:proteic killer suppression protein
MIKTIKHRGLKKLWEMDDPSALPAKHVPKIRRILETRDAMTNLEILKAISGYRLHAPKGSFQDYYSVTVSGNYRIIFKFENRNVSWWTILIIIKHLV